MAISDYPNYPVFGEDESRKLGALQDDLQADGHETAVLKIGVDSMIQWARGSRSEISALREIISLKTLGSGFRVAPVGPFYDKNRLLISVLMWRPSEERIEQGVQP